MSEHRVDVHYGVTIQRPEMYARLELVEAPVGPVSFMKRLSPTAIAFLLGVGSTLGLIASPKIFLIAFVSAFATALPTLIATMARR